MQRLPTPLAAPPTPILPARPEWIAAYWQAWRNDPRLASVAEDTLRQVRALRAGGLDDEAFAAACEFMDRVAAAPSPDEASTRETAARWPALANVLVEGVIGVTWLCNSVLWTLRHDPPIGLHGLEIDGAVVSLTAEADTGAGIVVLVDATAPFDLTICTQFTTFHERARAGQTRYLLTYLDRTDVLSDDN